MSTHRIQCSDRMCGADDCQNCHPENFKNGEFILTDKAPEELQPEGVMILDPTLLPCPFCGSTDLVKQSSRGIHYVTCRTCTAMGPSETVVTLLEAPNWNARVSKEVE